MCTTETPLVTTHQYVLQIQSRAEARKQQPKWLYLAKRPPVLQMKMGYQIDDKTLLDLHLMPDLPQGDSKGVYFIASYWSKLGTQWRT